MQDFETKYNELLNAVSDMRVKQKKYFGCRTSENLTMAKNAERKIDGGGMVSWGLETTNLSTE